MVNCAASMDAIASLTCRRDFCKDFSSALTPLDSACAMKIQVYDEALSKVTQDHVLPAFCAPAVGTDKHKRTVKVSEMRCSNLLRH